MTGKILVTGHKGFIGGHLTKALDERKIAWRGFDLLEGDDITDYEKCKIKMRGIDTVVHLAAKTGVLGGQIDPMLYRDTNIGGTVNLLKASEEIGITHFIYFSSASVYGNGTPPNSENELLRPTSVYGKTKRYAEFMVKGHKIPYTIIRPFNVYGENGRKEQVIYKWAEQVKKGEPITIRGDGNSKRGYTYVGDLVKGLINVIEKQPTNDTYNFGGEVPISLNQVAELFDAEREYVPMPDSEIKDSWADSFKANEKFGFNPSTPFFAKATEIISHL